MSGDLTLKAKIIRKIVAEVNGSKMYNERFMANNFSKSVIDDDFNYPEHLVPEKISMDNFEMEKLMWKDSKSRWAVLHLHGGGYVGAFRKSYKQMAGLYSEVGKGATVLSVDYRVAPEHVFPAALEDALEAYEWLLDDGFSSDQIVVAGDSAGGGLAMALCHTLKSHWLPRPAGIVAMSPWTDLTLSGSSYKDNYEIDPVFGNDRSELIYNNPYVGDADPRDPRISPMYGDFYGFPPMLIQVGTDEMLFSDSEIVAAKARQAGVRVRFTKYKGMFHVFQMAGTLMEESSRAWAEVKKFFEEI